MIKSAVKWLAWLGGLVLALLGVLWARKQEPQPPQASQSEQQSQIDAKADAELQRVREQREKAAEAIREELDRKTRQIVRDSHQLETNELRRQLMEGTRDD